jgi:Cu(I)/Ag(I) efflux system membrane fusion protein
MSTSIDPPEPTAALPDGAEAPPRGVRAAGIARWALVVLMGLATASTWVHYAVAGGPVQASRFQCPMHPTVVAEDAGECPACGMDLVPLAAREPASADARGDAHVPAPDSVPGLLPVELSAERIRLAGLKTAVATRARLAPTLRTVGFVIPDEKGVVSVSLRFAGWIESVGGDVGEPVREGAVLATVFSPDSLGAQRTFLARSRWGDPANVAPESGSDPGLGIAQEARERLRRFGLAPSDVDAIAESGTPTQTMRVRAPIGGYVVRKAALQGSYVQPGVELFRIADLSTVWVVAEVYETDVGRVRAGQRAVLEVGAHPGVEFTGKVSFVEPVIANGTRAIQVRVALANPGTRLRPGMFGEVTLDLGGREEIVVPAGALVDTGEVQYVFVSRGRGRFEPRRVRVGETAGGSVAVREGLAEGDRVVTSASFLLDAESRMRAGLAGAGGR